MRLTLRTMLAYMDKLLEGDDAQEIANKIEESEYATNLMHRIRDVMRRLRLAAPRVTDRGQGLDPNTVAEYLDNTLPAERVQEFEKICLDSDIHLAEVASCHQILAAVLGEPAEIDPESRQRMYGIPAVAGEATPPVGVSSPPPLPAERGKSDDHPNRAARKPVVPDYLREPRSKRGWLRAVAAVLLVAGFAVVLLTALGQFEEGAPLGDWLRRVRARLSSASQAAPVASADLPGETAAGPGEQPPGAIAQPPGVQVPGAEPIIEPAGAEPAPLPPVTSEQPVSEMLGRPIEPAAPGEGPQAMPETPATGTTAGAAGGEVMGPIVEHGLSTGTNAVEPPSPAGPPGEATAMGSTPRPGESLPGVAPPEGASSSEAAAAGAPVGRLMSTGQTLLCYDAESAGWRRVAAKGALSADSRLLALPSFRPSVALSSGIAMVLDGGSQLDLLGERQGQPVGLAVAFGRVVVMPLAEGGAKLRVVAGGRGGSITLAQHSSTAALEVAPSLPLGRNPESEPRQWVLRLYVTSGEVVWQGDAAEPVRVAAPAVALLNGPEPPVVQPLDAAPAWIAGQEPGLLDARAAATVDAALAPDRPAGLTLMELAQHRQREVRWLAARCLAYLGQVEPLVAGLNDEDLKTEWSDYVAQLRDAVVRREDSAAAVRQTLEKLLGPQAAEAYRMLWGYTDEDLAAGADAKLVEALKNDALPIRVLAFWNLKEITGYGLFYRPELPKVKRDQLVFRWQERLQAGEIRRRSATAPPLPPEMAPPGEGT